VFEDFGSARPIAKEHVLDLDRAARPRRHRAYRVDALGRHVEDIAEPLD
jgi:hypothetical protein